MLNLLNPPNILQCNPLILVNEKYRASASRNQLLDLVFTFITIKTLFFIDTMLFIDYDHVENLPIPVHKYSGPREERVNSRATHALR